MIYQILLRNLPPKSIPKEYTTKKYIEKINTKVFTDDEQKEFLKTGYENQNPLKTKAEYKNKKSNKNEKIGLLDHQKKFLRKFFLSNVSGCIVFHGTGTGQTLPAAVASH